MAFMFGDNINVQYRMHLNYDDLSLCEFTENLEIWQSWNLGFFYLFTFHKNYLTVFENLNLNLIEESSFFRFLKFYFYFFLNNKKVTYKKLFVYILNKPLNDCWKFNSHIERNISFLNIQIGYFNWNLYWIFIFFK